MHRRDNGVPANKRAVCKGPALDYRLAAQWRRRLPNALPIPVHLQIALDGFHAFRVESDLDRLLRFGLIVHGSVHTDNAVPVCGDTDVFQTSRMLGRELALDFRGNTALFLAQSPRSSAMGWSCSTCCDTTLTMTMMGMLSSIPQTPHSQAQNSSEMNMAAEFI